MRKTTRGQESVKKGQTDKQGERRRQRDSERKGQGGTEIVWVRKMLISRDSERAEMVSQPTQQSQRLRQRRTCRRGRGRPQTSDRPTF